MRKVARTLAAVALVATSSVSLVESASAAECSPTTTRSGGFKYITFTDTSATCTWTVPAGTSLASTILIVGGGGGAGYYGNAGGGGAGALVVTTNFSLTPGSVFNITIGKGGRGSTAGRGVSGSPTSFGSVTATGGGYGAGGDPTNNADTGLEGNGAVGGSGGGGSSYIYNAVTYTGTGGASNATTGISSPWNAFGYRGADGSGAGGGAGGAASGSTAGPGKVYFGNTYAKGGDRSGSNTTVTGSGNGGNVTSSGGSGSSGSITIQIPSPSFTYSNASATTTTGNAFANNAINSTGSVISSYSVSPALPTGLTLNSSTGQVEGTPLAIQSATTYTVTATDAVGETGTATLSLTITPGVAMLTITPPSSPRKGVAINLVVTAPAVGKIRFLANGKRIPNCLSVATTAVSPFSATCRWNPATQSRTQLTATLLPGSSVYSSGSAAPIYVQVIKRLTPR
ncbi:Putative Ig domain containing protein [Candidatus Nanopelagicaceae bacterium]